MTVGLASALIVAEIVALGRSVPAVDAFPAEQVARGEEVWHASCARCHGPESDNPDAPLLLQPGSLRNYPNASAVFDYIREGMPSDDPGTLAEQQYWDVLAFLLTQQGVTPEPPLGPDTAPNVPTRP